VRHRERLDGRAPWQREVVARDARLQRGVPRPGQWHVPLEPAEPKKRACTPAEHSDDQESAVQILQHLPLRSLASEWWADEVERDAEQHGNADCGPDIAGIQESAAALEARSDVAMRGKPFRVAVGDRRQRELPAVPRQEHPQQQHLEGIDDKVDPLGHGADSFGGTTRSASLNRFQSRHESNHCRAARRRAAARCAPRDST
jgi:hypothetical protein